jgi:hypothetical protein
MINLFYPIKDATIYETSAEKNTGVDSILELLHEKKGDANYNSRILLQFNQSEINKFISDYSANPLKYELVLNVAKIEESPIEVMVETKAISGSWEMGTGNYNSTPIVKNGTSWKWQDYSGSLPWITSESAENTYQFSSVSGGGTWHSSSLYTNTQSIANVKSDIIFDVTNIFNSYYSGTIDSDGILIKFVSKSENSSYGYYSYKFFSNESHTIYSPKLRLIWDDSSYSTGSLSLIDNSKEFVVYSKIKEIYNQSEKAKIRIFSRPKFIEKTYATQSQYLINYALPSASYYEIRDTVTDDVIIPFDTIGTKISCDSTSNYFYLFMDNFQPERYYKILVKVKFNPFEEFILDDNVMFKVVR